jgi:hypothetical protein
MAAGTVMIWDRTRCRGDPQWRCGAPSRLTDGEKPQCRWPGDAARAAATATTIGCDQRMKQRASARPRHSEEKSRSCRQRPHHRRDRRRKGKSAWHLANGGNAKTSRR